MLTVSTFGHIMIAVESAISFVSSLLATPMHEVTGISPLVADLQSPELLRAAREAFGLTYADLSRMCGVSVTALRYIEERKRAFTEEMVSRIWPSLYELDEERRSYKTPEVLLRIERGCLVATEQLLNGSGK